MIVRGTFKLRHQDDAAGFVPLGSISGSLDAREGESPVYLLRGQADEAVVAWARSETERGIWHWQVEHAESGERWEGVFIIREPSPRWVVMESRGTVKHTPGA